jgi:DNA polymerase III delta prime subunit
MATRLVRVDHVCAFIKVDETTRQNSAKASFKKPGKSGMNTFRAVMITGSPGIGKTTSAHLCARLAGYTPIELNASDARSKKLVEVCSIPLPFRRRAQVHYIVGRTLPTLTTPRWMDGWQARTSV